MVFVADDLGAWLVGLLADAGRRRLATLVLGTDQERALRESAQTAVQLMARELLPDDDERAEQLAMVVSQVFRDPVPSVSQARNTTLLEELQAGIAEQLVVLDDPSLTGTRQSSADVLEIPGMVLADRLISYLVREIVVRGGRGGPLTPLANQLNHDVTHLHGQRVEGTLAQLAITIQDALTRIESPARSGLSVATPPRVGQLITELTDPFALEVHRPIEITPPGESVRLPQLPLYVSREHDVRLAQAVTRAANGHSAICVLVGGSSTGKTRACWEAVHLLPPGWRLWHPFDPTRPEAVLAELPRVGPRTVVWLNETQLYLDTPGDTGERVAAALRTLLSDPGRKPVLVLGTLWPAHWDALTRDSTAPPQARTVLAGSDVPVPASFSGHALADLQRAAVGDARLAAAAAYARDGQITQYLAGVPELLARYSHAPPSARALIHAAMDARRLGHRIALPSALLKAAAPAYLTDAEWDAEAEDWLEQALAYASAPCKGVSGPLVRIRPRPARPRRGGPDSRKHIDRQDDIRDEPLYRLADYLDQHGRRHRAGQVPPTGFWAAAADHANPGDQARLGRAADDRGLYREAAQFRKNACAYGNRDAAVSLVAALHRIHPTDHRPALWAAAHLALQDPSSLAYVTNSLQRAGARQQVAALAHDVIGYIDLDDPSNLACVLNSLRRAGADQQVAALAERAAHHVALDDPSGVADMLTILRSAGASQQVSVLAERAAHQISLVNPFGVATLLDSMLDAGASKQATALASRAADQVSLVNPFGAAALLDSLRAMDTAQLVTTLLKRDLASHVADTDPSMVAHLLDSLREAGAAQQVTALASRAADQVSLVNPHGVSTLLDSLREAGAAQQVTALADRAIRHIPLDDQAAVANTLNSLAEAGAVQQAAALADRVVAHVALDDLSNVAYVLNSLAEAGPASRPPL